MGIVTQIMDLGFQCYSVVADPSAEVIGYGETADQYVQVAAVELGDGKHRMMVYRKVMLPIDTLPF